MNALLKILRLTCEDTSSLISEMMDRDLPFFSRIRVKFHLAICKFCEYYRDQLKTLRQVAVGLGREDSVAHKETSLPAETREKIRQMIKSKD